MKIWQRLFFYVLSLWYLWELIDLPDYFDFVKHMTFSDHPKGFYAYMIYTYAEMTYLFILAAWLGSTKGSFGRKFMGWYWQVVLFFCFITPIFHIFCPAPLGPGEVQTLDQSLHCVVKGIAWAVWSGWGLYHLYKYPVMPRAEKRFHQIAALVLYARLIFRSVWWLVTFLASGIPFWVRFFGF